jgi:ParB/RepB/Spo0J family partition protein
MKKKAIVEEVKAAPLTWKVSDDMMSIELSDGRRGKAVEATSENLIGCKNCLAFEACDALPGEQDPMGTFQCCKRVRAGAKAQADIVWIEDVAAALPPVALEQVEVRRDDSGQVVNVEQRLIDASPYQVRVVDVESDSFQELVASIKATGLINPITIRYVAETGRYELIAGHRRKRGCEVAGMLAVPCYIKQVSDKQAEAMTCCENLNREDLLPIDEALTVKAMLDRGRTREEIAKLTGKSTRWVYRREAAARLEQCWVDKAREHKLSSKFLEVLGAIDEKTRTEIALCDMFNDDDWNMFEGGGDVSKLEWECGMRRRKIQYAPWMELFPSECQACHKRTDTSEIIADEKSDAVCLDATCWKRNLASFGDRVEQHYKAQGVEVRRVDEEAALQMDLADEQSDEYDVAYIVADGDEGDVELHWGRSKPTSAKLAKKVAERQPTEQNILEKAFAEEVLERVERVINQPTQCPSDYIFMKRLTAAAISCGMEMVAPRDVQQWQSPNRASGCMSWLMDNGCDSAEILEALSKCVLAAAVSKLRIYNPTDTAAAYIYAQTYAMAFEMVPAEVSKAANARIPKKGKAKRK